MVNFLYRNRQFCDVYLRPGISETTITTVNSPKKDAPLTLDTFSPVDDDDQPNNGNKSAERVYAHKLVLDLCSPYFSQIFQLYDQQNKSKKGREDKLEAIIIPNMDYSTLHLIVRSVFISSNYS